MAKSKTSGRGDDRPYAKYAFLNPYNLSLLAGAASTAAITGHWWLGLCAGATEVLWMLFAPDSKVLQRLWFDKVYEDDKAARDQEAQDAIFKKLGPYEQQRAVALREQIRRIRWLAKDNPSLTVDLISGELAKLDAIFSEFLDLAVVSSRSETYLATFDYSVMERDYMVYKGMVDSLPPSDSRRQVAEKNIQVLVDRRRRLEDLRKNMQTARGHMDLVENTLRLLSDEIVGVGDISVLATRLDDVRVGIQAVRDTSQETESIYEQMAEDEAAEAASSENRRA